MCIENKKSEYDYLIPLGGHGHGGGKSKTNP